MATSYTESERFRQKLQTGDASNLIICRIFQFYGHHPVIIKATCAVSAQHLN